RFRILRIKYKSGIIFKTHLNLFKLESNVFLVSKMLIESRKLSNERFLKIMKKSKVQYRHILLDKYKMKHPKINNEILIKILKLLKSRKNAINFLNKYKYPNIDELLKTSNYMKQDGEEEKEEKEENNEGEESDYAGYDEYYDDEDCE